MELRFYGGYTDAEVALALGISERTVRRLWDKARAFLLEGQEDSVAFYANYVLEQLTGGPE